eukprot:648544-Pyramimonas_sp.AAC.1
MTVSIGIAEVRHGIAEGTARDTVSEAVVFGPLHRFILDVPIRACKLHVLQVRNAQSSSTLRCRPLACEQSSQVKRTTCSSKVLTEIGKTRKRLEEEHRAERPEKWYSLSAVGS